jgi:hypothetical protein
MFPNLHPKCANPTCTANFEWLAGGRLFRFNGSSRPIEPSGGKAELSANSAQSQLVKHFWLCEKCSSLYTLTYDPEQGVSIRALWPLLPAAKELQELPAFNGLAAAKTN